MSHKQFPPILDSQISATPTKLLSQWFNDARTCNVPLPTVGSVATCSLPSGRVTNRMLNFTNVNDDCSLVVYSDFYGSRKAKDLETNCRTAVTFYWQQINRSLRLEGKFELMSKEDSLAQFNSRNKAFKASVLLGEQSHPLPEGRSYLESKLQQLLSKNEEDLKIPDFWVGARLVPDWIEFWQGNPDRISDRIEYAIENGEWKVQRITP